MSKRIYATKEEAAEAKRRQRKAWREAHPDYDRLRKRESRAKFLRNNPGYYAGPPRYAYAIKPTIPQSVLDERERRRAVELTPNQAVLGDPLPGYSALDRRG